jgi:NADH-quinone oxidoreductase subunit M
MTVWSLLLIPLLGAVVVGLAPTDRAKWIAFIASSVTFVMSVIAALRFAGWTGGGFGLDTQTDWLSMFGITLNMHADTISLLLVLLTTLLMPACMAGSFSAITSRIKEYYVWMLILQAAMVGVFLARDLIFFYICFEFTLVPMYFLIAIYGGENRAKAATKFFIFTFTGSMITLAGLLYIAWQHAASPVDGFGFWSFDIPQLTTFAASQLSPLQQGWLVLALMAGFAVKVPLFPVHTWLPLAHTEAPTAGSVILAGVLLKLGTYGLYRFVLPMLPAGLLGEVNAFGLDFIPIRLIAIVSIIGILYAALICWVQDDIKRLVAYSSVSHLGFCVLGLFALGALHAQPRPLDRGALLPRGDDVRALPHARHEPHRRAVEADARLGVLHGLLRALLRRPAGPQRLRQRVPLPDRRVHRERGCLAVSRSARAVVCGGRGDRHDLRRDVPAHHGGQGGLRPAQGAARRSRARSRFDPSG